MSKSPSDQARDLMAKWNPPPKNSAMERLVGSNPPEGDTRATAAYQDPNLQHAGNAGDDSLDAGRMYADDEDADTLLYGEDLDDLSKSDLQEQAEKRGLPKSGNMDEIRERIDEFDADDSEDDDEDEGDDDEE